MLTSVLNCAGGWIGAGVTPGLGRVECTVLYCTVLYWIEGWGDSWRLGAEWSGNNGMPRSDVSFVRAEEEHCEQ